MTSDLILDFVNTLDLRPYHEELKRPGDLAGWFAERGLLAQGARLTRGQFDEAIGVREALRTLLAAKNGVAGDVDGASAELDRAARSAGLAVRFARGDVWLEPTAGGVRGAIGSILAAVAEAMADGTWERMKACRAEDCRWAFLDTAKNRSRAWCSMRSCGNREKVRAYRERHASHAH